MASNPSSAPTKPIHSKTKEPVGWNFETVRWMTEPIPLTYWFNPWINTERCGEQTVPPTASKPKFLYYATEELEPQYRGTGIIVEEINGDVVGCYKTHVDTDAAQQTKTDLYTVLGELQLNPTDQQRILQIPERNRTVEQIEDLAELQSDVKDWPKEVRRLNGELLDPRPQAIALHERQILHVHPSMAGNLFMSYGDEYRALKLRIRDMMGSVFEKKDHLPVWRLQQDEELEAAGVELLDFSDS